MSAKITKKKGVHALDKYNEVRKLLGIPADEPIFILRAQDKLSVPTISRYRTFADSIEKPEDRRAEEWFASLDEHTQEFVAWQAENAKKVKLPD